MIFRDIHPAAQHHYLVVTKNHIKSSKELTAKDIDLSEFYNSKKYRLFRIYFKIKMNFDFFSVKEMKNIGLEFIKNKGAEANQVRYVLRFDDIF